MEHSSSETSTAASEHSASHEAAPSSSSRRDATAPNSSSAKHSGATLKHFNVKTLKSMCKNLMAQKNKRAYKYSRATKSLLIEYILELQEFEDDEQEPVTQLSSLSEEDREKELDARRKERDRIVNKSLNLAKKPKTVRNKMTQIKKLAEYLREEEPSVVFFQQPPRPADDHAEGEDEDDDHAEGEDEDEERRPSANHVRLFESGWQIKWGKLTARILCRYLAGLEVERMSAQQLFLFDQAPKGKKPKFLKAHGGLEAIVTAVKWAMRAEQARLAEETNALLQHAIQSSVSYQAYLHKFCLWLQRWGYDDMVTDGVETKHDPPCQRLEDMRSQCRPGQHLQPRLRQVSTVMTRNFLVQLKVENRFKGASKGKMIVPAHGTHSWYRNALSHAFKIAEVPKPDDWDTKLGEFIRALKKKQAKQKAAGTFEGRHTGGRDKMDFDVFRRAMFDFVTGNLSSNNPKNADKDRNKTSDVNQIAGAKFCIDFWNFMCRSDNVKRLKWGDTTYACDYRTFKFHVSKNDQQGEKLSTTQIRHVFANPIMPEICPFLTEALYVLLVEAPFGDKVFESGIVKKLADLFDKWHSENKDWLEDNGFKSSEREDGHGVRKGVTTHCANIVDGPPIISVLLRAMWALGEIQQTYLSMESGSDLFLGRCVAGLPTDSPKFGVLPPHWKNMDDPEITRVIEDYYPQNVKTHPHISKRGLKMGLASLVFHAPWIRKHFHRNHKIFSHRIFTTPGLLEHLRKKLYVDDSAWTTELFSESSGILHKLDQRENPVMEIRVAERIGEDGSEARSVDANGGEQDHDQQQRHKATGFVTGLDAGPNDQEQIEIDADRTDGDEVQEQDGTQGGYEKNGGSEEDETNEGSEEDEQDGDSEEDEQNEDSEQVEQDEDSEQVEQNEDRDSVKVLDFPVPKADLTGLCLYSPHLSATGVSGHIRSLIEQRLTTRVVSDLCKEHKKMRVSITNLDMTVTNMDRKMTSLGQELQCIKTMLPRPVSSSVASTSSTATSSDGRGSSLNTNAVTVIDSECGTTSRVEARIDHLEARIEHLIGMVGQLVANNVQPAETRRSGLVNLEEDTVLPVFEEIDSLSFGIPEHFMLPHTASVKDAWMLWWVPAPNQGRCAIRRAAPKDFGSKRCKKTFTAWKSFFDFMLCKLWGTKRECLVFSNVSLLSKPVGAEQAWVPFHSLMLAMGLDVGKAPVTLNKKLRKHEGYLRVSKRTEIMQEIKRTAWTKRADPNVDSDSDSDSTSS